MVYQAEERTKAKKHQAELAIRAALEGRWKDAVQINQTIVESFPGDVDALNRLGKAMTELGKYNEAKDSYRRALETDPLNSIARKNLARLESVKTKVPKKSSSQKLPPQMFIEETGKTGNTMLVRPVSKALTGLSAGDQVKLRKDKRGNLYVDNMDGDQIGEIEPKLAQRLVKLMDSGNEYVAAISSISEQGVKVFIRESFQHESNIGKLSFPPSSAEPAESIRPYLKTRLLKDEAPLYRGDEDSDDEWDSDSDDSDSSDDDEDDEDAIDEPELELPNDEE